MLLDSQTKIAQKDAEVESIKESSTMQIANLQAKLEQQSEELNKKLETERWVPDVLHGNFRWKYFEYLREKEVSMFTLKKEITF